jgi:predicted nucleic acid-binding protein
MVLVDTSVWIRFMYGREPYLHDLNRLLELGQVVGHELVYGELLIGDPGGQRTLLENYRHLRQAAMIPHDEIVHFVNHRRLHGRGVGWIDIHLLASALVGGFQFWTADERCAAVAQELGVGYRKRPVA